MNGTIRRVYRNVWFTDEMTADAFVEVIATELRELIEAGFTGITVTTHPIDYEGQWYGDVDVEASAPMPDVTT